MSKIIKRGSQKLREFMADPATQRAVKAAAKNCAQNGLKSLLIVAEGVPILGPVAVLMNQLIAVCEQAKCNKEAFSGLKKRLLTFSQLIADLVQTVSGRERNQSLVTCMENLMEVMSDAEVELKSYTSLGYLSHFMNGSKPQETFDGLDADLTRNLNELSFALNIQSTKLQAEQYRVVCDIKNRTAVTGGDENSLQNLADSFGVNMSELKDELSRSLTAIHDSVESIKGGVDSLAKGVDQLLAGLTKNQMVEQCPKLVPGQCVWNENSKVLGEGAFGKVFEGTYRDEPVAIKTVKNCHDESAMMELLTEVCIHSKISRIPGVIYLYGADLVNDRADKRCVVMELAAGSLHDAIYKKTIVLEDHIHSKLSIMLQVAHTMSALHEIKILHRDIKPANILICFQSSRVVAKLSDFGLAKNYEINGFSLAGSDLKGTLVYMAPELRDRKYSTASDVFAFAVTLNEYLSNAPLFEAIKGLPIFSTTLKSQSDISAELGEVISECLKVKPSFRPVFNGLVSELTDLRDRSRSQFEKERKQSILQVSTTESTKKMTKFSDLSCGQVCDLFFEFGMHDVATALESAHLSGKYIVDDFLGKSKKEIQTLMKEDYDVDMHINAARALGDKIFEWHTHGLPVEFEVKTPTFRKSASSTSTGSKPNSVGTEPESTDADAHEEDHHEFEGVAIDQFPLLVSREESERDANDKEGQERVNVSVTEARNTVFETVTLTGENDELERKLSCLPSELLLTDLHEHPLTKQKCAYNADGSFGCDLCNLGGSGWNYSCADCQFDTHIDCALRASKHPSVQHGESFEGAVYTGDLVDGKRHGQGKYVDRHGNCYDGAWVDDKMHGFGISTKRKGTYKGYHKDNNAHGHGTFVWTNGDTFVGEFENNTMNGHGIQTFSDGRAYEGEWKDGERISGGSVAYSRPVIPVKGSPKQSSNQSDCTEDSKEKSTAVTVPIAHAKALDNIDVADQTDNKPQEFIFPDGSVYSGEMMDGMRHGKGMNRKPDGEIYSGDWKYDKMVGHGQQTFKNGHIYIGEMKLGLRNGHGIYTYIFDGGKIHYDGEWKDNQKNGRGTFTNHFGDVYDGEYKFGSMHGLGKMTFGKNKNTFEGEYDDNFPQRGTLFLANNGDIYRGEVNMLHQQHGKGQITSTSGKVTHGLWVDGVMTHKKNFLGIMIKV